MRWIGVLILLCAAAIGLAEWNIIKDRDEATRLRWIQGCIRQNVAAACCEAIWKQAAIRGSVMDEPPAVCRAPEKPEGT